MPSVWQTFTGNRILCWNIFLSIFKKSYITVLSSVVSDKNSVVILVYSFFLIFLIFCLLLILNNFSCSFAQLCLTLCDPMDCSIPDFPVLHHLLEFAKNHIHWVSDAIHDIHAFMKLFLYYQVCGLFDFVHQLVYSDCQKWKKP